MLHEDIWGRSAKAVRINAVSSPFASDDIATVVGKAGGKLDTIFLSKPETVDEIQWLDGKLAAIVPWQDRKCDRLCRWHRIGPGSHQYRQARLLLCQYRSTGLCDWRPECIAWCAYRRLYYGPVSLSGGPVPFHRARIILAARTYGLWALDAPWPIINDHATLAQDARWGAMMGFDGKLVLAPEQVRVVHEAYRPTSAELERARMVLAQMEAMQAAGDGSGMAGGEFLDPVVIAPAMATIARAEAPL
jgi:citrate lyase subunit beta/citryl-CoA lyase